LTGWTQEDAHGQPLETESIITLEAMIPGYVELEPGESATAPIGWAGWAGRDAGGAVRVGWPGGQAEVQAEGPRQPAGSGPATNLFSSWFVRG